MTIAIKNPPAGGADGPLELSSYGGVDGSESAPKIAPARDQNQRNHNAASIAADITCASMRVDELRACLIREIFRAALIGMQAQAALLDGDDDAALANLRRHWITLRADISPLAAELLALQKAGTPL